MLRSLSSVDRLELVRVRLELSVEAVARLEVDDELVEDEPAEDELELSALEISRSAD